MDAVRIEHFFAHALGIEEGKRGEVNDAAYVRSGEPKYLVRALDKALPRLRKRAGSLPESGNMKMWIDHSVGDMQIVQESISRLSASEGISQAACFQLWSVSAILVNIVDAYLRELGR